MNDVNWIQGDILHPERWKHALQEVSAVISCVGAFGSNQKMLKINGEANIAAINAASESGVTRFVYISAVDYGLPSFVLGGYFKGKKAAEEALLRHWYSSGISLEQCEISFSTPPSGKLSSASCEGHICGQSSSEVCH
jgi:nucleoside-diphosphate-sugar epimerase